MSNFVLGFSRDTEPLEHIQINKKILVMGIGSGDDRGQEAPLYTKASWRTRKAGGEIQSETQGLRTWGATGISSGVQRFKNQDHPCPKAGEDGWPRSSRQRKLTLLHLLVLLRPSVDRLLPTCVDEGDILY